MSDAGREARQARAQARRGWQGRLARLEELPAVELADAPPAALIGRVTELTLQAWALSGEPLPTYTRAQIPGRLVRGPRGANE